MAAVIAVSSVPGPTEELVVPCLEMSMNVAMETKKPEIMNVARRMRLVLTPARRAASSLPPMGLDVAAKVGEVEHERGDQQRGNGNPHIAGDAQRRALGDEANVSG